jgi:hypothetical protein
MSEYNYLLKISDILKNSDLEDLTKLYFVKELMQLWTIELKYKIKETK